MHYENENCDTDDLNRGIDEIDLTGVTTSMDDIDWNGFNDMLSGSVTGTIEDLEGIPAALLQQFYYNGKWHDRLTRREAKRRRYIQARWKITEADGSIRYTDETILTIYCKPSWCDRIIAYFRTKREQRRQSKMKRT